MIDITKGPLPRNSRELYELTEQYLILPDDFFLMVIHGLIERLKKMEEMVQDHDRRVGSSGE